MTHGSNKYFIKTFQVIDIPPLKEDVTPLVPSMDHVAKKSTYTVVELLSGCQKEVHLAHAILAALPETDRCCLLQRYISTCTCPKLTSSDESTSWFSDLLLAGVLSRSPGTGKSNKLEVRRARCVLHFTELAVKAHFKVIQSSSSTRHTRSSSSPSHPRPILSKTQRLLEDGLDLGKS